MVLKDKGVNLEDLKKAKELTDAKLDATLLSKNTTVTPTSQIYIKKTSGAQNMLSIATKEETIEYLITD